MKSYIAIHNFMPKKPYPNNHQIQAKIKVAIEDLDYDRDKEKDINAVKLLSRYVYKCMQEYNFLTGVTEDVLDDYITHNPKGLLPKYVEEILKYFIDSSVDNKEINILKYSGIKEIKIRYKHADSVIKKLVKKGFNDIDSLEDPVKVFLRGGLLHDLIGIQFICAYPYQAEWLARALYHYFKIPNRTDDHLIYGFYRIDRKSGYKGLHCDRSYWSPAFDNDFIDNREDTFSSNDISSFENIDIPEAKILNKYYNIFNIEIQIHTSFQSIWSKMEHEKSYDVLAKGKGKLEEITVLWKMLSDNLENIENQFQRLQVKTEQSIYEYDDVKDGYGFISEVLSQEFETLAVFNKSVKKTKKNREKLIEHEISREDYVVKIEEEIQYLTNFLIDNPNLNKSAIFSIKLQKAFIYYSFANHRKYFNDKDLANFLKDSVEIYNSIINDLWSNPIFSSVNYKELMIINAIIRYGRLTQKYGLGLINKDIIEGELPRDINKQNTSQNDGLKYIGYGLDLFINLNNVNAKILKSDRSSYFRTIHYFDKLTREIEISGDDTTIIILKNNKEKSLSDLIVEFRQKYMKKELSKEFMDVLDGNSEKKITNTSFIMGFLSTLIINKLEKPIDILERVVKLSSHDNIKASDIFLYEYSAYMFSYVYKCIEVEDCITANEDKNNENKMLHHGNYHYENMINLLFRIKKEEDIYEFLKAKTYFNQIKGRANFQEDYLSKKLKNIK